MREEMRAYEVKVWNAAVYRAESDVLSFTAALCGGRHSNETVESYVSRVRALQDEALDRLDYARRKLMEAKSE